MMKKVIIIGGGAAGMMAAVRAADCGAQVQLLEKNEKLGKKIFITGKGRCNVTNACSTEDFFDQVISNPKFLYSSVYGFDAASVCEFFEKEGLHLKEERGQRIFPVSDKSSDVIRTLEQALKKRNVDIFLNTQVKNIEIKDDCFFAVNTVNGRHFKGDALIIATGGLSYKSTGSTGDGYRFAQSMGHSITATYPSLVGLRVKEAFVSELEGLSLRNIHVQIGKYTDFGEMLFTRDGVSGPVILSASAKLCKKIAETKDGIELSIDLKPALSEEQLDSRILRDFSEQLNKDFKNALSGLLPSKLIPVIIRRSQIPDSLKVRDITREQRRSLVQLLKNFTLTIIGNKGFEQAVITQGGIKVKEVDPSTMSSKLVKGVYFAGEVLDLDAFTGGFNLQIAWSTGYLAGESAARGEAFLKS